MSEDGQIESGEGLNGTEDQEGQEQQERQEGAGEQEGREGQQDGERQPRMVPHSALHEERQRRKEAEDRARRAEEQYQRNLEVGNHRLQQLITLSQQRPQQGAADALPPPSLDQDPVGFVGHMERTFGQKLQAIEQRQAQIQTIEEHRQQLAQLSTVAQAHVQTFAQQNPDYFDALQHVRAMRAAQYRAIGLSEEQMIAQIGQDELAFASAALQNRRNIAESLYEFAKASGYAPKAAERKPSETLAAEAKGVAAARSLGTGGGASKGAPSLEALAAMSDEEFVEATKGDNWRRLMGA